MRSPIAKQANTLESSSMLSKTNHKATPRVHLEDNRQESKAMASTINLIQKKASGDEALIKTNVATRPSVQKVAAPSNPNNTGLPDNLKAGIESISGYAMDDVRVHYNSSEPAQLNAHAYAQGSAIHLGPGQEKHLPHEAWHVVQQKQGRVKPTRQLKGKFTINDDVGLEREADVMGARALKHDFSNAEEIQLVRRKNVNATKVLQGNFITQDLDPNEIVSIHFLQGGTLNKGVFRITNPQGATLVIKFTDEDAARPEFADQILTTVGVNNTNSRSCLLTSAEGVAIGQQMENVAADGDIARVQHGRTARFAVIMEHIDELNFFDTYLDHNNFDNKPLFNDPAGPGLNINDSFAQNLGRMFAADTILGNSDRIVHAVANNQNDFVAVNGGNFKVSLQGVISTIDNDAQLLSRELLQTVKAGAAGYLDMDTFVDLMISGYQLHPNAASGLLPNMGAQDCFNNAVATLLSNEIGTTYMPDGGDVNFNNAEFELHFNQGVQNGLTNILAQASQFLTLAAASTSENIRPEALIAKLSYVHARTAGANHITAVTSAVDLTKLLSFDRSLLEVPTLLGQDKKTKAKRALSKRSEGGRRLEVLKTAAQSNALTIDQLEMNLIEAKNTDGGAHRKAKAVFTLGLKKLIVSLSEKISVLNAAITDISQFQAQHEITPYMWLVDPNNTGATDLNSPLRQAMFNPLNNAVQQYLLQLDAQDADALKLTLYRNQLRQILPQFENNVIAAVATLP